MITILSGKSDLNDLMLIKDPAKWISAVQGTNR